MLQCRQCTLAADRLNPAARQPLHAALSLGHAVAQCPDGIFAALALHLAHKARGVPVEYVPNTVWAPVAVEALALLGDETAFLLDFSGGPGFARRLAGACARVVVLDHHKTAAAELGGPALAGVGGLEVTLDMERSGATISLDYFQPPGLSAEQRQLFRYIEDADLWRWRLPDSKAFTAGLASLQLEYDARKNPAVWDQLLAQTPQALIQRGAPILAEQQRLVEEAVAAAFPVSLGGEAGAARGWGRCLAVRVGEQLSKLRSQLGNALAEESAAQGLRAMAVVAYVEEAMGDPTQLKCSLRSVGGEDTTPVSEAYGGGGHRNASSFICPAAEFERWRA